MATKRRNKARAANLFGCIICSKVMPEDEAIKGYHMGQIDSKEDKAEGNAFGHFNSPTNYIMKTYCVGCLLRHSLSKNERNKRYIAKLRGINVDSHE